MAQPMIWESQVPERLMDDVRSLAIKELELERYLKDEDVLLFVESAFLSYVPNAFFLQPASSSGKYHPDYSQGVGGLVRHTKAVVMMCHELFTLHHFDDINQDYIIAAAYLHDTMKPSPTHPVEVRLMLEPLMDSYYEIIQEVVPILESHMGQWDQFGKLPKPKRGAQKYLHMCDFIISRKFVNVKTLDRD